MLYHIAGERHGEVVAETLLTEFGLELIDVAVREFLVGDLLEVVAGVEHLEQELVALLAILAHERVERLHRRGLDLAETIELECRLDGVEDIIALRHLLGTEVARSLGDGRFICHSVCFR